MSDSAASVNLKIRPSRSAVLAALASSLLLGACAQSGSLSEISDTAALSSRQTETSSTDEDKPKRAQSELEKATEYWGKQSQNNPKDLKSALNYARNLKAMGKKGEALQVLQQSSLYHGQNRELASEYGRLALDLGQTNVAQQVLTAAEDPANPDWRVTSARGTVLAKQGKYSEAIPFYEKALSYSTDEPSVLNNLAMAYTMNGEPQKAENLLRQAAANNGPHAARIRQNLALVLGVQGRHDEAKQLAAQDGNADATANAQLMAQIVKSKPAPARTSTAAISPGAEPGTAVGGWSTRVVPAKPAR